MTPWKFTDDTNRVVFRILDSGGVESVLASALPPGTSVLPADAPVLSQDDQDAATVRQYAKLVALRNMTPAQVDAWVTANVTDLPSAKDAIKTLAIAVSVLARRI